MLLQLATSSAEMNMKFPPARIEQNERLLNADEVNALPCTGMAKKAIEQIAESDELGQVVDMRSETVSHHDDFGYVYRYRATTAFRENGKSYSHDYTYVLWSEDCKSMGIALIPMLELNLPRSSKGL